MRCTGCGLLYVETSPSDCRLHKRVHSEVVDGPRRTGLSSLPICYKDSNRTVVVINAASPIERGGVALLSSSLSIDLI